jgi:hypothetical protein
VGGGVSASVEPSEAIRDLLESHGRATCAAWSSARSARRPTCCARPPDDIKDQWQVVPREALLTMKAPIDRYVERLDAESPERGPRVQDIPIE